METLETTEIKIVMERVTFKTTETAIGALFKVRKAMAIARLAIPTEMSIHIAHPQSMTEIYRLQIKGEIILITMVAKKILVTVPLENMITKAIEDRFR